MEQDGSLINEFKTYTEQYNEFKGIFRDWLVFMKRVWPPGVDRKTSRFYEIKWKVIKLSKDGKTSEENYIISNKIFLIASFLGGGGMSWDPFYSVLDEGSGYLYVSCAREYMIHIFDLNKGEAIRSFKRKYKRIRHEMSQRERDFIKKYNAPRKKYEADIERLHLYKGLLWVETSTKDEERGIMIDVFNNKGQFVDNFYLALDGYLISVQDNLIFVGESNEDGNIIVKKYIIEDEN